MARQGTVLFSGDSRVRDLPCPGSAEFGIQVQCQGGATIEDACANIDNELKNCEDIKVVVVVAFQCDLTERRDYLPSGGKGLVTVITKPNFDHVMNVVTCYDHVWRTNYGVSVIWTVPYPVDFLRYNRDQARKLRRGPLCQYAEMDSTWSSNKFKEHLRTLAKLLKDQKLNYLRLDAYEPVVTEHQDSDGLHLGLLEQGRVFRQAFVEALRKHPMEPPQNHGKFKSIADRAVSRKARHRRQTRARIYKDTGFIEPAEKPPAGMRSTVSKIKGNAGAPSGSSKRYRSVSGPSGVRKQPRNMSPPRVAEERRQDQGRQSPSRRYPEPGYATSSRRSADKESHYFPDERPSTSSGYYGEDRHQSRYDTWTAGRDHQPNKRSQRRAESETESEWEDFYHERAQHHHLNDDRESAQSGRSSDRLSGSRDSRGRPGEDRPYRHSDSEARHSQSGRSRDRLMHPRDSPDEHRRRQSHH